MMNYQAYPGLPHLKTQLFFDLQAFIAVNGGRLHLAQVLECEMVREPKRHSIYPIRYDFYSNFELGFIIDNYKKISHPKIAAALNRPLYGINDKIYRLRKAELIAPVGCVMVYSSALTIPDAKPLQQ